MINDFYLKKKNQKGDNVHIWPCFLELDDIGEMCPADNVSGLLFVPAAQKGLMT